MRARWLGVVSMSALLLGCGASQGTSLGEPTVNDPAPAVSASSADGDETGQAQPATGASSVSGQTPASPPPTSESSLPEVPETSVDGQAADASQTDGVNAGSDHDHDPLDSEALAEMERALDEIDRLLTDLELDLEAD